MNKTTTPAFIDIHLAEEVNAEIKRAFKKHGYQDIPSVDKILTERIGGCTPERMCEEYEMPTEMRAKFLCDNAFKKGQVTHAHIVVEELSEVISCNTDEEREKELIQLIAVSANWLNWIRQQKNVTPQF